MKISTLAVCLILAVSTSELAHPNPPASSDIAQQLDEVARVGSVMVDGDLCQKIVTAPALKAMFQVNPRDPWLASDNYDVDDTAFNSTKKTLVRLSHLVPFPADVNLWMPIAGHPDKIQIVIRNVHEMSQFWPWGALYQPMPPDMKTVLKTGRRLTVSEKPRWISVLAPVYNSLGDIVGMIEVATNTRLDAEANVK